MPYLGSQQPGAAQQLAGYNVQRLPVYTQGQNQLLQQGIERAGPDSFLGRLAGGDESLYRQIEEPALKQFSGVQGNIASRFSGMGSGARRSSGFQNTMNEASNDFVSQLQGQRLALQRQALMDLSDMTTQLLGARPYETFLSAPQQKVPFWQQLLGGMAPFAGAAIGGSLGGIEGARLGGQIGGGFGQAFM